MAFINNTKFKEIFGAANEGNEKAKMILQAMRKASTQEDVDRLVAEYYNIPAENAPVLNEEQPPTINPLDSQNQLDEEFEAEFNKSEEPQEELPQEVTEPQIDVVDLTDVLDQETEGLFDKNEIADYSFDDFLTQKSKDNLRAKKNADYFKAYDLEGRTNYMNAKIEDYKNSFNNRLGGIRQKYDDISNSINKYYQGINDLLDDDKQMNVEESNMAYNDFVNNKDAMASFGRYWDEQDNNNVAAALQILVDKYGKQNVLAALNTLKSDNDGYRDYLNNQIDEEVGRYSKSIQNILK